MPDPIIVFSADPETGAYLAPVQINRESDYPPLYSTTDPGLAPDGKSWFLIDGLWAAVDTTPEPEAPQEIPVLPVTIVETSVSKVDGLYQGFTDEIIIVRGVVPYLPAGIMTVIVQEVARSKLLVREHRFQATIEETEDPIMRSFTLRMRFSASGNYLITQERLNEGLAEIGMPVRISMPKLDFNIVVAV